ncbi:hypothetical protein IMCC3317_10830 [Kordia antarctica]|uniref:Uncharacterized protein n=1 Tax=Kordia antarctica TaxID=1218801 RepID=A0A7L4ZGH1_9FLAO|nr:hypothetical protein [Kordia antarctica]QHI35735.1 hypothetical protein IMCC3317_10830 [Kordia antarctica]
MKENKKSKKKNIQRKLDALEENIRIQDQKEIQELFKKMSSDDIPFDMYVDAINKQLSFHVSFDNIIDEEE